MHGAICHVETHPATSAREAFWRAVVSSLEYRIRAYVRTMRCDADEADEILWDIWDDALTVEAELMAATDKWAVLSPLVRRACAKWMRISRRERHVDVSTLIAVDLHSDVTADASLSSWLDRILRVLPEKQRLAVEYRCRRGWPYWAVAAALDVAEPTARVHVARAIKNLRRTVEDDPPAHS